MKKSHRRLSEGEIHELKRWNTPTIYNGWEQITRVNAARDGFNLDLVGDYMPQMGPMASYTITVVCEAGDPKHTKNASAWSDYRGYVAALPGPKIVVKLRGLIAMFVAVLAISRLWAGEVEYRLTVSPLELVASEDAFRRFAQQVRAGVERSLGQPSAIDDSAVLKTLLSTRVHLALHFRDHQTAVATAAWIRSLQEDPAERAFAGVTTFAAVNAQRKMPGFEPLERVYREAFSVEFARLLSDLPRTPAIAAVLRRQREKIADLSEAALLAEVRDVVAPAIERRGMCSLTEADQLVRVRHRLVSILPLRGEMLAALDRAIAERLPR